MRAAGAGGLALGELLLDGSATRRLLLDALALGLGLLLGEGLRLLVVDLARALLHLGLELFADLVDVGVSEHARMRLRRYLHLMKAIEQIPARHIEFLRQLVYAHAGIYHSSFFPAAASHASAASISVSLHRSAWRAARSSFLVLRAAAKHSSSTRRHRGPARASGWVEGDDSRARAHDAVHRALRPLAHAADAAALPLDRLPSHHVTAFA